MKILNICKLSYEGAGNAAYRLNEALLMAGIDSTMLAMKNNSTTTSIVYRNYYTKLRYSIQSKIKHFIVNRKFAWDYMFGSSKIKRLKVVQESNIVYLHWINGYIGYKDIKYLLDSNKIVIWFLHDMWPMTGGCHYAFKCEGYTKKCCKCPQLKYLNLLSMIQLKKKIHNWSQYSNFIIASPSEWLANCAHNSSIFIDKKIYICRNVVNTEFFKPLNRLNCRRELGLDIKKKYIMFSAVNANNIYKGFEYLCKALLNIKSNDVEFLIVGNVTLDLYPDLIRKKIRALGYIRDERTLIKIYNSADAYIISSIAENFPNVVIEAMSCGIPVVGFATGGISEQITHMKNGYLVKPKDCIGLANGVDWILNNDEYDKLCYNARKYVTDNCSYINVLKNHHQLLNYLQNG
jgi:glycosyltransferase involved in cell wall biosynthesis